MVEKIRVISNSDQIMNSAFKIAEFDACIIVARSRHRSIIRDEKQIELKIEFFFSPLLFDISPKNI